MAIAFSAAGTRLLVGTASTAWDVPYPATVNANDLLVLYIVTNGAPVSLPSGWTAVYDETVLSNPKGGLFIKTATGSETGTLAVSVGSTTGNAAIFSYTGVDPTTPQDAAATSVTNSANTTSTTLPAITTVTAGALLVYANGLNSGSTTNTAPGTERIDNGALGGTGTKAGSLYDEPFAGPGSTGDRDITLSASRANWGAMMALRPASAPSGNVSVTASPAEVSLAAPDPTVTVPAPAGAAEYDFDDGTAQGWTVVQSGSATTTIVAGAAHDGSYGVEGSVPNATGDVANLNRSIGPADRATISGWWRVTTEGASSSSNVPFARLFYGSQRLADVYRQNVAGGSNVWLRVVKAIGGSNYYYISTGHRLELNTWTYVEFSWGLDGVPSVKLDGVEYIGAADQPADWFAAPQIDTAYLGSQETGNQGVWNIDTVTVLAGTPATSIAASPAAVSAAAPAPTITATRSVTITATPAATSLASPAPTVSASRSANLAAAPAAVALAAPSPAIAASRAVSVTAPTAHVTAAAPAPTVSAARNVSTSVTPAEATVAATAPTTGSSRNVGIAVSRATLTVASPAPSVSAARTVVVTVTPAAIALLAPAPVAAATRGAIVAVTPAAISTSAHAPTLGSTRNVSITASPATLAAGAPAPAITATRTVIAQVTAAHAVLAAQAPALAASRTVAMQADPAVLVADAPAPVVSTPSNAPFEDVSYTISGKARGYATTARPALRAVAAAPRRWSTEPKGRTP